MFSVSETEAAKLGHDIKSIAVDLERGEFYFADRSSEYEVKGFGPIKLPREGFVFNNLLSNTFRDRSAKTPAEKILRTLTNVVRKHEPEVYGKTVDMVMDLSSSERKWQKPDGTILETARVTIEGFKFGKRTMFFDMDKKEFWLEQSDSVSHGHCEGPYKLPNKFEAVDIETLSEQIDANPANAADHVVTGGHSYSSVTGGMNSATYLSIGGGGSGGSSVGGGGSGGSSGSGGNSTGSVFSHYLNSRSSGGGGS